MSEPHYQRAVSARRRRLAWLRVMLGALALVALVALAARHPDAFLPG